ncbi:FxSxx-COOH system tetratricopeptide repeat protein [Actinoplanes sp. CA-142083]|uniref:FxSxx-COOH system tetratricopeptide repeat protein n=1 Tax=Actinoplanes sp. CA-142083 TaxID=3239903 RepID=UPI003D941765
MTHTTEKDPASEFRKALVAALVDVPITHSLADRRLLINLIRRDIRAFPDVPERDQARTHVTEIVLACTGTRGGLRALKEALIVMAPDAPGTRLACALIDNASLASLLLQGEGQRVRQLLRQASAEVDDAVWRETARTAISGFTRPPADLVEAFELAADQAGTTALTFLCRVAADLDGAPGAELRDWALQVAERLEPPDQVAPGLDPDAPEGQVGGFRDENSDMDNLHYTRTRFMSVDDIAPAPEADAETVPATHGDTNVEIGDDMAPVTDLGIAHQRLPQVWGDVPQRNPDFTGREEFLESLHRELSERRQTAVLPQAIHGMGGVGKSQIAIEYVHRHSEEFDLVWWIPAEETGQILTSLTKLAQRLKLDVSPEANAAVPAVQEALSTGVTGYRDWLLVFDNAEDPTEVRKYFPTGGAGRILVTSRNPDWERGTRALEVDVFTREESRTYLRNRHGDLSDEDTESLADALGDLPLAIEAASAWRATTGMEPGEYLRLLSDKRLELFDVDPPPDYRLAVRAAWSMSLEKLAAENPGALQLLQVCSFFAPEPISRSFLTGWSGTDITPELDAMLRDTYSIGRAIRDILKLALGKYDHRNNTLQIHRLIRLVLVDSMDPDQQKRMRRGAHMLLANADPIDPSRRTQWDRYSVIRPHLEASDAVSSDEPRVHDLVFSVTQYLYYYGDHQGSEALAEQSFAHRKVDRGPADAHTLRLAKWLSWMYSINGRYEEARALNQQTLDLYRESFGDEDEGTLDAMKIVAKDLRVAGDFGSALELDQRAVEIARRNFGEEDPVTLQGANSLGVNLRFLGRFREAEQVDRDNYRRLANVLGSDSDAAALSLYNLLIDRREAGDYVAARKEHEAAYTRSAEIFGKGAPATLRMARALSVARRKAGDHPGALQMSSETFDKYQRRYGDDYPETIATALDLAVDRRHDGDLQGARRLGEDTLERYLRLFGPRHPYTLSARTNLAVVLRLDGDLDRALAHDKETLSILKETLGADHPVTLICATNYSSDLFAVGDVSDANEHDIDTLSRSERVLGPDHPSTLACSVNVALDLRALGRVAEADRILSDTLASLRRALGERHPATLNALQNLRADCDVDPMPL